jgi:cytochrome oxidase Cu insertion factor (SCO1/SenC/PrrC family)
MNRFWGVAFGLLFGAVAVLAADPAPDEKTGLKAGEKAPEFKLKDQSGEERTLSTMLKDGPVALVFYRSASW